MQYETTGTTYTARMEANGRIVIPARVRAALGLVAGCQLTLSVEGDSLVIHSKAARVRQVRERLRAAQREREAAGAPPAGQVVEAFLAERREEEARRRRQLNLLFPDRTTHAEHAPVEPNDPSN